MIALPVAAFVAECGLFLGAFSWIAASEIRAGVPPEAAARQAFSILAYFLAPWSAFAGALAHSLAGPRDPRDPIGLPEVARGFLVALAGLAGTIAAIAILGAGHWLPPGRTPAVAQAAALYGSLRLAGAGLWLFTAVALGHREVASLAVAAAVALATGSLWLCERYVERGGAEGRDRRIDLVLSTNLLAAAEPLAGADLLRSCGNFYRVFGAYPYRYPELATSRNRFLAIAGLLAALALAASCVRHASLRLMRQGLRGPSSRRWWSWRPSREQDTPRASGSGDRTS